jgi:hypothetical protein
MLNVQLFNTDPCPNKSFKFDKGFEVLGFSDIMETGCTECVLIAVLKLFVPIFGSFVIVDDFLETSSFDCLVTGTIDDLAPVSTSE